MSRLVLLDTQLKLETLSARAVGDLLPNSLKFETDKQADDDGKRIGQLRKQLSLFT